MMEVLTMHNSYNGYNNFNQQQNNYQTRPNGNFSSQQQNNSGYRNNGADNHVKIQVVARLVKDPESKPVNNSKVASSKVVINHRGGEKADFWFIEVWGNENSDGYYKFLLNHCPKGRKVFIEGIPELRQTKNTDGTYTYYPTIKVTNLIGLDGGNLDNQQPTGQFKQQTQGVDFQPQHSGFQPNHQNYVANQTRQQPQQGGGLSNIPIHSGFLPQQQTSVRVGAPASIQENIGFPAIAQQ
ncbi:TPA: single-stranded DNA-binding protein [Bacillus cereus]|nr:single-stranded DNA-binding protein [Bacillus cereus]MDR4363601.1 single-stranded DNA-binding protein [Bacillus cereus]HDR8240480.1 single-stranded DNA-binding protein [Bacillus cereus]